MIDAKHGVLDIGKVGLFDNGGLFGSSIVDFLAGFGLFKGATREQSGITLVDALLLLEYRLTTVERCYLVALHGLQAQHLMDGSIDGERTLGRVAQ